MKLRVAEKDIWSLMQFTENFRRSMEIILKKLYVKRMADDIGVTIIYSSGKTVFMKTNCRAPIFGRTLVARLFGVATTFYAVKT
ncbi:hypothetical protein Lalb_Chr24g0402881 [Lupinus albus]|uniref:Uncharacterized protein n=1 Tax=Lupinus albus TaxID=3870 RepID=A0A6A4N1J6_LUPAL|nr:hypothetical protein Lalb_Chr24g0402881 [Lupinus albus]